MPGFGMVGEQPEGSPELFQYIPGDTGTGFLHNITSDLAGIVFRFRR